MYCYVISIPVTLGAWKTKVNPAVARFLFLQTEYKARAFFCSANDRPFSDARKESCSLSNKVPAPPYQERLFFPPGTGRSSIGCAKMSSQGVEARSALARAALRVRERQKRVQCVRTLSGRILGA